MLLSADSLFLLDDSGRLIEKLVAGHLGLGSVQAGFRDGSRVYLRDAQNTVQTDAELMDSRVLDPASASALDGRDWQVRGAAVGAEGPRAKTLARPVVYKRAAVEHK